jgi:hypothetical protein
MAPNVWLLACIIDIMTIRGVAYICTVCGDFTLCAMGA